jgi:hypothetical protein
MLKPHYGTQHLKNFKGMESLVNALDGSENNEDRNLNRSIKSASFILFNIKRIYYRYKYLMLCDDICFKLYSLSDFLPNIELIAEYIFGSLESLNE